jgi:uncharacterized tellurite resistance protein B-like protein
MFGRWMKRTDEPARAEGAEQLDIVIRRELPAADAATTSVVTSIAGLLGTVAYADRKYSPAEEQRIRLELARIEGMSEGAINAICAILREHIIEVSTVQTPRYCRALLELADHELRIQVLEVLLEIAAADGEITHVETNVLRQVTTALGLTQGDYNVLQEKHRAKLSVLG